MKMRKILSFVLVLSLVLGSFSMAFAATPATGLSDITGIANEEAIQVNADLGIITGFPDGTFLPEKSVTRAEFAAMITRALAVPESALAGYTSTTFKDTAGYGWAVPYLAFAQSKGIMIGDGQGNAMPGRTINVNEAMTMVLRAIGYVNHSAELVGTWPSNYVTVAQNVGLYDDVAATLTVDRANAAQIIYNALTVQKVSVNADGETTYLTTGTAKDDATLLNTGLGATMTKAVVNPADNSLINAGKYAGVYGEIYKNKDGEIIAVKPVGTTLTGTLKAKDGTTNVFKADGVEYKLPAIGSSAKITIASDAGLYLVNGVATTKSDVDSKTVKDAATASDGDKVTLNVELSGKTVKSIYSMAVWKADRSAVVSATDLEQIKDKKLLGGKFIQDDDKAIDLNEFVLVGVASLDKIAKDNVVYVYYNDTTNKEIKKIAVGTEIVTGKITVVDGSDFYVSGKAYSIAAVVDTTTETPKAGDEVKLYLDAYGKVYKYEKTSGTTDKYGVIMEGSTVAIDGSRAKIYTADADDSQVFGFASTVDTKGRAASITSSGLVAYGLNKDGKINAVERGSLVPTTDYQGATLVNSKVLAVTYGGATTTTFAINSDVVVFTAKTAYGDIDLSSIDKVEIGSLDMTIFDFILDRNKVVAMVVKDTDAQKSGDEFYGVFNKRVDSVDANDDAVYLLTGFVNGAAVTDLRSYDNSGIDTVTRTAVYVYEIKYTGDLVKTSTAQPQVSSVTVAAFANDKTTIQDTDGTWYGVAKDVVVYEAKKTDGKYSYSVSSVNAITKDNTVWFYDFDADDTDANRGYSIVIFEN